MADNTKTNAAQGYGKEAKPMASIKEMRAAGRPAPEQIRYANMVFWGAWISIAIMLLTYTVYVSGIIEPYIPLKQIPHYWSMPADAYTHEANVPVGWGWAVLIGHGDFLNFAGIVLLAAMTVICFLVALLPAYIKKKDWLFSAIVALEVTVLCLAASGIFGSGGH